MNSKVTHAIIDDLRRHLLDCRQLPFKITLASIADYYQVSVTPVREVVDALIDEGVLARQANSRLVRTSAPSKRRKTLSSASLQKTYVKSESLEAQVTNEVVRLCLQKYSEYLREEATAKKYHTGRTAIRQVFSRLAGVGIIEHVPRCGWKVSAFREKDMFDYLKIREVLEVKALKLARPHFKSAELELLLKGNIVNETSAHSMLDNDLHHYWINRCDNRYIQDFFQRHGAFYSALFDYAALGEQVKAAMAQEHRDILQALLAGDWAAAEKALVKHIRDQKENVLRLVKLGEKSV